MDLELLEILARHEQQGERGVLVTICRTWGSTPRKAGAKMLVMPDGRIFGTIGGGCGEDAVRQKALEVLDLGRPVVYRVDMTADAAEEEGMVCGGVMEVFLEIHGATRFYSDLLQIAHGKQRPTIITIIRDSGEPAALVGAKTIYSTDISGTLGRPEVDRATHRLAEEVMREGQLKLLKLSPAETGLDTEMELLLEPFLPAPELLILGGGHIALPLNKMANILGYRVTVIDDRPGFANSGRFPEADRVICAPFGEALQQVKIGPASHIVIVTRGHRHDQDCLRAVANFPAAYIGMIGSRRRVRMVLDNLRHEGLSPDTLTRIHTPIGLDIAAQTPEEIAVSILAEIISVYRGGRASSLKIGDATA